MRVRFFGRIVAAFRPFLRRAAREEGFHRHCKEGRDGIFGLPHGAAPQHVVHRLVWQLLLALERPNRSELDPDRRFDLLVMQSVQRKVRSVVPQSDVSDENTRELAGQARKRDMGFSERLNDAMVGREDATLARSIGVSKSLVGNWRRGTVPSGPTIFRLADELGVSPRWLATGLGPQREGAFPEADPEMTVLPRFDILRFSEHGKPEASDQIPVRSEWLIRSARSTKGLWLADMPSDAMPDVAREGDALVCQDVTPPLVDGRTYIFLLSGRPLVRRVQLRREGLVLQSNDASSEPITVGPGSEDDLVPIGRVVAALSLRSV